MRFARFQLVGVAGAIVQLLTFELLAGRVLSAAGATALAVELAVLHNFLWHERFTWRDRGAAGPDVRTIRLVRFHAANGLVSVAANTAIVFLLHEVFGVAPLAAAAIGIGVCAPVNFLLADRWVYRVRV